MVVYWTCAWLTSRGQAPQRFRYQACRDTTLKIATAMTRPQQCGLFVALGLCPVWAVAFGQGPGPAQDKLLASARQYAGQYLASLPSFICTQTTDQFEGGKKAKKWRKGDSLTSLLVWDQGHEERTLQLVNARPVSELPVYRAPLVSEGEFGNLLDSVLGSTSPAQFSWHGWDVVNDKRVGVFDYQVDQQSSQLRLSFGGVNAVIAFHGAVYIDPDSGSVWRITNEADGFPSELQTKSLSRLVDYSDVMIGPKRFVLPVHAVVLLDTGHERIKNELRFENYRKFSADSHVTFSSEAPSKTVVDSGKH